MTKTARHLLLLGLALGLLSWCGKDPASETDVGVRRDAVRWDEDRSDDEDDEDERHDEDDEERDCQSGRCRKVELVARKSYSPSRNFDANATVAPPMRFRLPRLIRVTNGNSGNHWVTFKYGVGSVATECRYRGGSSQANPVGSTQINLGRRYLYLWCSNGARPGDTQTADRFLLTVNNGSSRFGTTEVQLTVREKQPCVGGVDAGAGGGTAGGRAGGSAGGTSGGRAGGTAGGATGGSSGGVAGGRAGGAAGGTSGGVAGGTSGGVAGGRAGGAAGGTSGGIAGGTSGGIAGGASGGIAGGASGGIAGGASGGIAGGAAGGIAGGASGGVAGGTSGGTSGGIAGGTSGGIAGGTSGGIAGGTSGGIAGGTSGGIAGGTSGGIAGGASGGIGGGTSGGVAGGESGGVAGGTSGGVAGGTSGGTSGTAGGTSVGGGTTAGGAGGGTAQALSVVIDLPIAGTVTSDSSVTVIGRILSGTPPFTATVNGTNVAVSGLEFTAVVSPPEGSFSIAATARDSLGATGQAQRTIVIDRSPPVITMIRPTTTPAQATTAVVTIEGEAGDPNLSEVRVQGQLVPTLAGRFLTDVSLSAGRTDVLIEAVDSLGNRASFTQRFDAPALPPTVTILAPAEGASVDDAIVRVRARVNANTAISRVEIGTGQAVASPTGDYEADVPLALGQNTIVVRAVDVDGREGTAQVHVQYRDPSTEPLKVTGIDPSPGSIDLEPDIRVSIAFNKAVQAADFTSQFVVKANGTIIQGGYYLVPGSQTVSFSATSPLPEGQTITVEVQNVSPRVGPGLTAPFRSSFTIRQPLTELHGVVLDETATPIPNVLVELEQLGFSTRTSGQGNWSLFVPGSGRWKVKFSGGSRGDGRELPSTSRLIVSTAGSRSTERTVFLVPVDTTAFSQLNSSGQPAQVGEVTLTLPSGSFAFADGRLAGGLTMTRVPAALRSPPLSDRIGPTQLWQSSPVGTRVLAPISASVPNTESAPAGRLVLFYAYVPELLTIARAGFGRVTSDGSHIETIAPFQPASLEWFGYRVLSVEESDVIEAALNPRGPANNGGVPDGSLGWLRWAPERFDGVVDWVLPRAHADTLGLWNDLTGQLARLDALSFLTARVGGTVRAPTSTTRFIARTGGLTVLPPPTGQATNEPNPVALQALTALPNGQYRLLLEATAQQSGLTSTRELSLVVSARRGNGSPTTAPADSSWTNSGLTSVALNNAFVDLDPGTTFVVFRLVEGTEAKTIEHRVDLSMNPDGGAGALSLTETGNTNGGALESLIRFANTRVTLNGPTDTATTTGPTGEFGFSVFSLGAASVGIACAQVTAGARLEAVQQPGSPTTFKYLTTSYDFCSPQVPFTTGMKANVDINVDARLFYGSLTFRNRKGQPIPLRCDDSLTWREAGDTELDSISARDIETTEVSVFRADDLTEPIAVVTPARVLDQACRSDAGAPAAYSVLRLGPQSLIRSNQLAYCRDLVNAGIYADAGNAFFDLNCGTNRPVNATLRPGDPLVVVAVNYRTGYAGLTRTRVPSVNQQQGIAFEDGLLPDGGLLPGTILPDGGCTVPPVDVAGTLFGVVGQLPSCTVQSIGIPTDLSLYPPELQVRVSRSIKSRGLNPVDKEPSLVRTGGMAVTNDRYMSVMTRWGVRTEPDAYRQCVEQRRTSCEHLLSEVVNDEERDAGALGALTWADGGRPDAGALVDIGVRGLPLEVPCGDLPPGAPDAAWNVCLGDVPRIVDMPAGVAPLYGQLARWTGSAIEEPSVVTFRIRPGQQSDVVQVPQTLLVNGTPVSLSNLTAAAYYVHAVGQSQFGETTATGSAYNRTPTSPPPAPFFSERLDGGSLPARGIGLKSVYRSYEPGAVVVERFDATREHEFRVVDLDAGAVAVTAFGTRSLTTTTSSGAAPRADTGDLAYAFTAALLGPATQSRAQQPLREFRVRLGSDAFGQECDLRYEPIGQTIRGQCDADAVEDVLAANDIVYLELYLAGNAENVLWRTNFYGLTRRTDIVATNSLYTYEEATNPNLPAKTAKSRQSIIRPIASFPLRQDELRNNASARVRLCSNPECTRVFASASIRRESQRFRILSVESGTSLSPIGIAAPMGPDGTAIFAALLPEDYAVPESHESTTQPPKPVYRIVEPVAAGPTPAPLLLGTPRGRFESFDMYAWGQPEVGPVSVTTGRLAFEHTDLVVPYSPSVMAFTRAYNNQNNIPGVLGIGWRHPFEAELIEESPARYVATVGMMAYQFVGCSFDAPTGPPRTAGQCDNDGTHGATLEGFSQSSPDGGAPQRAFVVTEVSGRRLLFRHQIGLDDGTHAAVGSRKAEFIDGGSEVLQKRWFLAGIDEGAGVMEDTSLAAWFGELPSNWQVVSYDQATTRVARVHRQGVDGGLEWKFQYEPVPEGVPSQVRSAARIWGLKPLKRVALTRGSGEVASVEFARDGGSYSVLRAIRSTGGAAEQEWSYDYMTPPTEGIVGFEASNEVLSAALRLTGPDGGARQVQWRASYGRTSVQAPLAPLMKQVDATEFVSEVTEPGQQGVPYLLNPTPIREVFAPTGEETRFVLAPYGASRSTTKGPMSLVGAWTSQQDGDGLVRPAAQINSTQVGVLASFDARVRPTALRLLPNYQGADPQLGTLSEGDTATVTPLSDRFAHGQEVTSPATAGLVTAKTTIDHASGDVVEESLQGVGGTYLQFSDAGYDSQHRLKEWIDEQGRIVRVLEFDTAGLPRIISLTKPGASAQALATLTRTLEYDSYNRVTSMVDQQTGAETTIAYDVVGRELKRSTKGADGGSPDSTVRTSYELGDNRLTITRMFDGIPGYRTATTTVDGLVTRSEWTFGATNALASEEYTYDAGRLFEKRDARGVLHRFEHTPGTGALIAERVVSEDGGLITLRAVTRDDDQAVTAEVDVLGAVSLIPRDTAGRNSGIEAPDAGASSVKATLDLAGFATKVTVGTKEYGVVPNAQNLPAQVTFGTNGTVLTLKQTFDAAKRVLTRDETVSGVHEEWKYDDVLGRVTSYKRTFPTSASTTATLDETRSYQDDPVTRTSTVVVTRVVGSSTGTSTESETLVVDVMGRLLSRTENITTLTGSTPSTTSFSYDAMGRLIEVRHPDGSTRRSTYDGPGALLTQTDEANNTTTFTRDELGLVLTVEGQLGLRTTETHDAAGRLVRRTEANAAGPDSEWTWEYPGDGWVHEKAPAPALEAARVTKRRFNGRGQVVEVQQHAGGTQRVTKSHYDGNQANLVEVTDGTWKLQVRRDWDGQGRPTLAEEAWADGTNGYLYKAVTAWDSRTATVTNTWDSGTAPSEVWEYDGLGNAHLHRVGVVEDRWVRDGLGRLKEVDTAEEPARTFEYGSDGRLKLEKFGPEETKYGYNVRGLLAETATPDGRLTTTKYEFEMPGATIGRSLPTSHRLSSSTAPKSTTTETDYDELSRPIRIRTGESPEVATTHRSFGPRGELRAVTLPTGDVWRYEYDGLLRLTAVHRPDGGSSSAPETFEREDGLGRLTRHAVGGHQWLYSYDGGVTTELTPNQESRVTVVDGRGRAAHIQYFPMAATPDAGITSKTLHWDGWDALVQSVEGRRGGLTTVQTFSYDTSHRLTSVVRGLASVTYGYDNSTRQPSSKNGLGYGYDTLGRLSSVTAPWGVTTVGWEAGGQRLKTLGAETFDYDGRGWLASVTTPQGVRQYSYDSRGNRLTERVTGNAAGERRFSYDSADRLVATQEWDGHIEAWALHGDGAKAQEKQWPAGTAFNQLFNFGTANPVVTKNYTYRPDGTLESVTNALNGVVEVGYTHDSNGQVTQRTVGGVSTTYGWDVDGRLVTANSSGPGLPTLVAEYEYDGLGMRRRAQVAITPINGPPVTTIHNWKWGGADGEDEVEEDGNVTTFVAGYRVGDDINVFSHDGLGSVVAQSNSGSTNEAQFSTWGTRTALATNFGPLASSAGFTGHREESALELIYAEQRWQDPRTGTWMSRDPVGAASFLQSPNELNPWQYAAGNPTRHTDPDGRRSPTLEEEGELNEMGQVVDELRTERATLSGWRQTLAGLGNDGLELVERNLNQRRDAIALAEECWGSDCQPQPVVFGALAQANAEGGGSPFGFVFDGEGFPYLFTQEGVTVNQLPLFPNWHGYDIHDQVASADRGVMENVDRAFRLLDALKGGRLTARRPGTRGKNTFAPARTAAAARAVKKFLGIGAKPPTQPSNPFANKPPDSPIYTPYDPRLPGRPDPARTVDSRGFVNPGDFNAEGFPRDNLEFWRLWRVRFPETISPSNAYRLDKVGVSPVVDATWLKSFPEHAGNRGQTLVHHHVVEFPRWPTGGPSTMPVPSGGHPGSGGAIHGIP